MFGALKPGFLAMATLKLVVNVVGRAGFVRGVEPSVSCGM